jgi:hypothetical protein
VRISVAGTEVTGRAFLEGGGYDDQVYEKLAPGEFARGIERARNEVEGPHIGLAPCRTPA